MPSPLAAAAVTEAAEGQVQEDIRLVEGRGAGRADEDAAALAVAAVGSRAALAALGHVDAQQAVAEADGRRVRGTTDGHGDAAADAVAAVGPRAAGTALGQVAQEGGVGDGRGRVILESETAADAVATGLAAGPGAADCRVNGQRAVAERETPAVAPDAAADASATGAAAGLVVADLLEATFSVPWLEMPPPATAELPLTVQLVSVTVACRAVHCWTRRRHCRWRSCR